MREHLRTALVLLLTFSSCCTSGLSLKRASRTERRRALLSTRSGRRRLTDGSCDGNNSNKCPENCKKCGTVTVSYYKRTACGTENCNKMGVYSKVKSGSKKECKKTCHWYCFGFCCDSEYNVECEYKCQNAYSGVCATCEEGYYGSSNGNACHRCEAGYYCTGGVRHKCPAGTYGENQGATSASDCLECRDPTNFCPAGTNKQIPVPINDYATGCNDQGRNCASSQNCEKGYYCALGARHSCPAGRYGTRRGETSSDCTGQCPAGSYCPAGTYAADPQTTGGPIICGSADVYCPAGSGAPQTVSLGHFSTPVSEVSGRRTGEEKCPAGKYCIDGIAHPCPAGRYGAAEGEYRTECSAPCRAGYYCPAGSSVETACGEGEDKTPPQKYYCPPESGQPFIAPPGTYTGPCTYHPPANKHSVGVHSCPPTLLRQSIHTCGRPQFHCPGDGNIQWTPEGYYSSGGTGPTTRVSQTLCEAGYFCTGGNRTRCKAGASCPKGSSAQDGDGCTVANAYCPPPDEGGCGCRTVVEKGYYAISCGSNGTCLAPASGSAAAGYTHQRPCNRDTHNNLEAHQRQYYCPLVNGSHNESQGVRKAVDVGYYAAPTADLLPTEQRACTPADPAHFCEHGERKTVDPGHFSTPETTLRSSQAQCGSANHFCQGGRRFEVRLGSYSTPREGSVATRTGQRLCPAGYYCTFGIRHPCPRGTYNQESNSSSLDACLRCPQGKFNSGKASSHPGSCLQCAPGFFSLSGARRCWPGLASAIARDDGGQPGLGSGDTITIRFNGQTNQAEGLQWNNQPILGRLDFRAGASSTTPVSIGTSFNASWTTSDELVLVILNASGSSDPRDTRVGFMSLDLGQGVGLRDGQGWSQDAVPLAGTSVIVGGSWGSQNAPAIVSVTAVDDLKMGNWRYPQSSAGLTSGDVLEIRFNSSTSEPPLDPLALEEALTLSDAKTGHVLDGFRFSPGEWVAGQRGRVLRVTFDIIPPVHARSIAADSLNMAFNCSRIVSRDRSSPPLLLSSHALDHGSWGVAVPKDHVVMSLVDARTLELRFCPPRNNDPAASMRARRRKAWSDDSGVVVVGQKFLIEFRVEFSGAARENETILHWNVSRACPFVRGCSCEDLAAEGLLERKRLQNLPIGAEVFLRVRTQNYDGRRLFYGPPAYAKPVTAGVPIITSVFAQGGSTNMATDGGEQVDLYGDRFGSADVRKPLVTYGPYSESSGIADKYTAKDCTIRSQDRITCLSVNGTGKNHVWTLRFEGESGVSTTSENCCGGDTCMTCTSYAPPTIYRFYGAGVDGANDASESSIARNLALVNRPASTSGYERVLLVGSQLGPVGAANIKLVQYWAPFLCKDGHQKCAWNAINCTVIEAHTVMLCLTTPGVGASLVWAINIDGQENRPPSTTYAPPAVTRIGPAELIGNLLTKGGQHINVYGENFGAGLSEAGSVQLTYQGGDRLPYSSNCSLVVPHKQVRCSIGEGFGNPNGFGVTISVAGQRSQPFPTNKTGQKLNYGVPIVTDIMCKSGITETGQTQTAANNLARTRVESVDGSRCSGRGVPTDGTAFLELSGNNFGNDASYVSVMWKSQARNWTALDLVLVEPHTKIKAFVPKGQGCANEIKINVGGLEKPGHVWYLDYQRPQIDEIGVSSYDVSKGSALKAGWVDLEVIGRGFGDYEDFSVAPVVSVQDEQGRWHACENRDKATADGRDFTHRGSFDILRCNTTIMSGKVKTEVAGQVSSLEQYDFIELMEPPVIESLNNTRAFATSGGDVLRVEGNSLLRGKNYTIGIGVAGMTSSGCPSAIYSCIVLPVGSGTGKKLDFLDCWVPAGAGRNLPVTIYKWSVKGYIEACSKGLAYQISYQAPMLIRVSPNHGPTTGGSILNVSCLNCGRLPLPADVGLSSVFIGNKSCAPITSWTHRMITCVAPPGVGQVSVSVIVAGQVSSGNLIFSYDLPQVASIVNLVNSSRSANVAPAQVSVCGGSTMLIQGSNFGAAADVQSTEPQVKIGSRTCVIVTWNHSAIQCVSSADAPGSYAVSVTPVKGRGLGRLASAVEVRRPKLISVNPLQVPTRGGSVLRFVLEYFCSFPYSAPRLHLNAKNCSDSRYAVLSLKGQYANGRISCTSPPGEGRKVRVSVIFRVSPTEEVTFPVTTSEETEAFGYMPPILRTVTPNYMRTIRAEGGTEITITGANFGISTPAWVGVEHGDHVHVSNCTSIHRISHEQFSCSMQAGYGYNMSISANIAGQVTNQILVSYGRPVLSGFESNLGLNGPVTSALGGTISFKNVLNIPFNSLCDAEGGEECHNSCGDEKCPDTVLRGSPAMLAAWLSIEGAGYTIKCSDPRVRRPWVSTRSGSGLREVTDSTGRSSSLRCTMPAGAVGSIAVRLHVAGAHMSEPFELYRQCPGDIESASGIGYYGAEGSNCTQCPLNADCDLGALVPSAKPGFWASQQDDGSWAVLSCIPPSACISNNTCEKGYTGSRCAVCCYGVGDACKKSDGSPLRYYRPPNVAECVECPDLAWLFITAYVLGAMFLAATLLYLTQKREINFAGIRIAVDYYQVLSMFAGFKVDWPPELRVMWQAAATANVDPDITAPGCSIDLTFVQKWAITEAVPLGLIMMIMLFAAVAVAAHYSEKRFPCCLLALRRCRTLCYARAVACCGNTFLRRCCCCCQCLTSSSSFQDQLQEENFLHVLLPGCIGAIVSVLYYLYLLLVKGAFEIFNCDVVGYREVNGKNITITALSTDGTIMCGDSTHNSLVPPAIASLLLYGLGTPLFFGTILYRHRHEIRIDQRLRIRGEGYSAKTNPAYWIRKKYERIYQHYKPERSYWGLVILCRKFMLAACTLLLRDNPRFQVSVALSMLFTFFILQVYFQPYMERSAMPLETLLVERARSKRTTRHRSSSMSVKTRFGGGQARQNRKKYVYDYNILECTLLICGIFLLLSGLVFNSSKFNRDSVQHKLLLWLVVVVVVVSSVYCLGSVALEVVRSWRYTSSMAKIRRVETNLKNLLENSTGGDHQKSAVGRKKGTTRVSGLLLGKSKSRNRRFSQNTELNRMLLKYNISKGIETTKQEFDNPLLERSKPRRGMSTASGEIEMMSMELKQAPTCQRSSSASSVGSQKVGPSRPESLHVSTHLTLADVRRALSDGVLTRQELKNLIRQTETEVDSQLDQELSDIADTLPADWGVSISEEGQVFFYHKETCETTWEHPGKRNVRAGNSQSPQDGDVIMDVIFNKSDGNTGGKR